MKRLSLKLALFLPVLLTVVGLNYLVDPANLFQAGGYEQGVARLMLAGQNVANVTNYDERLLQKFYIQGLTQPKDIVVLGSSRSMQIRSERFPGQTFFNNSVSGDSLEDDIAIHELYLQLGLKPATIILGLDPWLLNRHSQQSRWKSLDREYQAGLQRLQIGVGQDGAVNDLSPEKYLELISPAYFQKSLRAFVELVKNSGAPRSYYSTSDLDAEVAIRRSDGSLSYDAKTRASTSAEVRQLAIAYLNDDPVYSLGAFAELDAGIKSQLSAFVDTLQREKVRVVFFLPPYHPEAYMRLVASDKYRIVEDVERYFVELAGQKGVTLLGSYNPINVDCGLNDFYDGMHPRDACIEKIFKAYK